jgi:DNA-binding response OmpR family regulator
LQALSVLIIEDDEDSGELLADGLRVHGADVRVVGSGANGLREVTQLPPDVLLCDLGLPDGNGLDWLQQFRAVDTSRALPAIALSGYGSAEDRARTLEAGFEKHLRKPARLADIIAAVAVLGHRQGPQALRPILVELAEVTGCRFTSLLRFDGDALVSLWTHDRTRPALDPYPLEQPVEAHCALVREASGLVAIEDVARDPRTASQARPGGFASYIGAPLLRGTGELFGAVCSYDPAPRVFDDAIRAAVAQAARALEVALRIAPPTS